MSNQRFKEYLVDKIKESFKFSLDKKFSMEAIIISFKDSNSGVEQKIIGVPYTINEEYIEIGLYVKNALNPMPKDYNEKRVRINLNQIMDYDKLVKESKFI